MPLDVELLARFQFAFTVMFHYLFPPLTIGLGVIMVIMEGMYLWTGDKQHESMARFWTKIFALNFAIGVASGIVMEFEFGTNWAGYSRFVGDVFGSALAAEGIFAFFLESGFLAVLVFGWDRVSPRMHFFSTLMVALGSMFSAVWIVVANSWQQTPAGYQRVAQLIDGKEVMRAEITDFWAVVFNPSTVDRLTHVLIGALIMGAFFVMSVSAYYLVKGRHQSISQRMFTIALGLGTVASLAAVVSGHHQAKTVSRTQPPKLAAMEGHFRTGEGGTPLYLFGIPDEKEERVRAGIAVPGMLSWLLYGDTDKPVPGLDQVRAEDRPPVFITFATYHIMVALSFVFIVVTVLAVILRWRGTLFQHRWLMKLFVVAVIGPVIANQFGWVAAEVGRQPWIVWGELRTRDALSASVPAGHVLISIIMFGLIYLMLLIVWLYVLDRKIRQGPEEAAPAAQRGEGGLLATAAAMTDKGGRSLTDAKDEVDATE